jgi:DNA-binding MarR family transcriptional regulator
LNKYEVIKELLELLDVFWADEEAEDKSVESFCRYTLYKRFNGGHLRYIVQNSFNKKQSIGYLIGKMCRYARFYNRELLRHTDFATPEEFGLAASLIHGKTPKKTELLGKEVVEVPTGMAILKRLVNKGILMEIQDADDKRALRIGLTPYGREKVLEAFRILSPLNEVITGPLSDEEVRKLIELLSKLDEFHQNNYQVIKDKLLSSYEIEQKT